MVWSDGLIRLQRARGGRKEGRRDDNIMTSPARMTSGKVHPCFIEGCTVAGSQDICAGCYILPFLAELCQSPDLFAHVSTSSHLTASMTQLPPSASHRSLSFPPTRSIDRSIEQGVHTIAEAPSQTNAIAHSPESLAPNRHTSCKGKCNGQKTGTFADADC